MLKSNDADLELFLEAFIEYMEQKNECKDARLDLNLETVTELIESMDTEGDKKMVRVILGQIVLEVRSINLEWMVTK